MNVYEFTIYLKFQTRPRNVLELLFYLTGYNRLTCFTRSRERGIRTPVTHKGKVVFKTTAIDHSAISL